MSSFTRNRMENFNYYNDARVVNSMRTTCWTIINSNERTTVIEVSYQDSEGNDLVDQFRVSTHYQVCTQCQGSGKMVDPVYDAGGLTREELDFDPDFKEDYFSGRCDVLCSLCNGNRVILNEDKSFSELPLHVQQYITTWDEDDAEYLSVRLAELRMGC